tara:strand:- start:1206 stop:1619 length:414 start_codon:yes stop_codon:yes gene_type:complete
MIEPILIRGNKRMSIYGQLEYEKNQQSYYTWNKELDFIIKQYPITNPVYEYSPHDMRFNISTKTNVSALTERQKKFLDFDPWNRPLRKWIPETKVADNSHFSRKYGRGPFDWLDTYDQIDFRWTTIENKGIQFYKYL